MGEPSMTKRITLVLLLAVALPVFASQWRNRIDLNQFLTDANALHQLVIRYTSAASRGQVFYIHVDGRVVLQQLPRERGVWNSFVPTCNARVPEDTVITLVKLLIDEHFFDLPEKTFFFQYASDDPEEAVHIHSIVLRFGEDEAGRSFATGSYNGQVETIPKRFAA